MDPIALVVLGRILERALVAIGGILALYLGFRLFAFSSKEESRAEIAGNGFIFRAERIGPGIFFALFGALLLGYAVSSQISITSGIDLQEFSKRTPPEERGVITGGYSIRGYSDSQSLHAQDSDPLGSVPRSMRAANTLIHIYERQAPGSDGLFGADFVSFQRAASALEEYRRAVVDERFGPGTYDMTLAMQAQCAESNPVCRRYLDDPENASHYGAVLDMLGARLD